MTILIVDDELHNQKLVTMLLERQGHSVVVAENGEIALQKIAQDDFDLIFMDMQMPVLDGLETIAILRACENDSPEKSEFERRTGQSGAHLLGKHLHVIAVTGNLDEQSKRRCLEAGMDSVLSKPFSLGEMNTVLEQFGKQPVKESTQTPIMEITEKKDLLAAAMEFLKMNHPLNDELLGQLLHVSVRSLQQSLEDTGEALENDDFLQVANGAHKIKGTLLALGVDDGVNLCRSLQESAEQKNGLRSEKIFDSLKTTLKTLIREKS